MSSPRPEPSRSTPSPRRLRPDGPGFVSLRRALLMAFSVIAIVVSAVGSASADPVQLIRRPYLQLGTPTSMVVRWRTDVPTDTLLRYGTDPHRLAQTLGDAQLVTEHEVAVQGLASATRYYYSVGTSTEVLATGPDHYFETSPPHASRVPVRIWVIGDSGTNTFKSADVRDRYLEYAGSELADVWLMLGDNAYPIGNDAQYTSAVFDNYPGVLRNTVLWPTPGNHDFSFLDPGSSDPATETGPYYDSFTLPTQAEAGGVASGTETYYSFDFANVHFVNLEVFLTDMSATGAMTTWLHADLAATDQDWTIAYLHFPPYSAGGRDSDVDFYMKAVRERFNPIFEQYGVDLVLAGHSHTYERSLLLDGHYGVQASLAPENVLDPGDGDPSGDGPYQKFALGMIPHRGTVYVVNGVGENAHADGGPLDHAAMVTSLEIEGSMLIDVDGDTLEAVFISRHGDILDRFRIEKALSFVPAVHAIGLVFVALTLAALARRFVRVN